MYLRAFAAFFYCCVFANAAENLETNWPHWRGPNTDGRIVDPKLPLRWDDRSIVWRTPLPGSGQSTPVVWNDRVFLTSASQDGTKRFVHGIDRMSGKILWTRSVASPNPAEQHNMNSFASASCATDGEHVVAFFGRAGVHCFGVDGEPRWARTQLGEFAGPWGTAASPAIIGDLVIQNCDADADACLIAFHKRTGETAWRVDRDNFRGWSTPFLIQTEQRPEMILNGHRGLRAYDPQTGRELWFCQSFNGRGAPTPVYVNEKLIVLNGKPGDIYAVRPGGNGDVTDTHMVWHTARSGRDLPSPAVSGEFILTVGLRGIATCYDLQSGKELWKERLGGIYAASPVVVNGRFVTHNEAGETFVIEPGEELAVVAKNQLAKAKGEIFRASITPHRGQLLLRSDQALYCIGN